MSEEHANTQLPEPLIANQQNSILHSMVRQLEESQWWDKEKLRAGQLQQLKQLLAYTIVYSPFYKERLKSIDPNELTFEQFQQIPVLTRADIQANGKAIDCTQIPTSHGRVSEVMTSGSTAEPVSVRTTGLTALIWNAINLREHLWHEREIDSRTASIRWRSDAVGKAPKGAIFEDWGMPINQFYKSSAAYYLNSSSNVSDQIIWLEKIKPEYLMTHPSNMQAILEECRRQKKSLSFIREIRTVGESVSPAQRQLVEQEMGIKIVDFYSSQELGYIALQCPVHSHYHLQSESLFVEVLREDGSNCEPFEAGRIVVTSLRNFATPLIRYEVGDYGELGESCACGRSLPVLAKINGRVRNMLQLPNGDRHWPNFGFRKIMDVTPLQQFQIVQHSVDKLELKLVTDAEISAEQEASIKQILTDHLDHFFVIEISYHAALPRSANGKYEDFVSNI